MSYTLIQLTIRWSWRLDKLDTLETRQVLKNIEKNAIFTKTEKNNE